MIVDPVVEQLHKQREKYMESFQYDLEAIVRDIRAHGSILPVATAATFGVQPAGGARTRFARR